jgi:hypothetical protein
MAATASSGIFPDAEWAAIVRMRLSRPDSAWGMRLDFAFAVATAAFDSKRAQDAAARSSARLDFPAWTASSLDALCVMVRARDAGCDSLP